MYDGNYSPIRAAKRLLTEIVEKGRPAPAFNHNDGPGMTVQEIMVPASKAGLVIGKGGETIKSLQVRVLLQGDAVTPGHIRRVIIWHRLTLMAWFVSLLTCRKGLE